MFSSRLTTSRRSSPFCFMFIIDRLLKMNATLSCSCSLGGWMVSSSWCLAARRVSMLVLLAMLMRPWDTVPTVVEVGRTMVDVVAATVVVTVVLAVAADGWAIGTLAAAGGAAV